MARCSSGSPSNNETSRKLHPMFKKRLAELTSKALHLRVLCDVPTLVVIRTADGRVFTWPEDQAEVRRIADRYRAAERGLLPRRWGRKANAAPGSAAGGAKGSSALMSLPQTSIPASENSTLTREGSKSNVTEEDFSSYCDGWVVDKETNYWNDILDYSCSDEYGDLPDPFFDFDPAPFTFAALPEVAEPWHRCYQQNCYISAEEEHLAAAHAVPGVLLPGLHKR